MGGSGFVGADGAGWRSRGLLIASVSLLAGIAVGGTLLSRPSTDDDESRSALKARGTTALPAAVADGEVALSPAPAGPTRFERGVPAGFARSVDGAVAAAASFVCTGQALLDMDPLAAEEAVRQMSSAATAERQVADTLARLRIARSTLAAGIGPTVYRQAALAWRVESYSPDRTRVAVWNVGVLAREGVAPPQAGWAVSTFDLVWEAGDWKVFEERITPGPAPLLDNSAAPATAAQLIASLAGFEDRGHR